MGWLSRAIGLLKKRTADPAPDTPVTSSATAPINPFQSASDRLRKTATWLAGTLAAIATVMLAGSQLSSIGSISFAHDRSRLIVAVLSSLVVVGAVAYAVNLLAYIQMPSEGTLGQIRVAAKDPNSSLAKLVAQDSGLRDGRETLTDFIDEYETVRGDQRQAEMDIRSAMSATRSAQTKRAREEADVTLVAAKVREQDANAIIADLRPYMVTLAQLSSYLSLRDLFLAARSRILFAALTAAAFLVLFAWAVNPPKPEASAVSAIQQTPSAGRLLLTPAGVSQLSNVLGHGCAASAGIQPGVAAIALASVNNVFDVVVIPEGSCAEPVRVMIPLNLGRVVSTTSVPVPGR
jgi:hypothetical protein